MRRVSNALRSSVWLLVGLIAPIVVLVLLRRTTGLDFSHESVEFHLMVVTSIAAAALITAIFASVAAVRLRQPGAVLLAAGCLILGGLMVMHGLVTPGVRHTRYNLWVSRAPLLAILAFSSCQFLAAFATT